jgi:hypothetical protein
MAFNLGALKKAMERSDQIIRPRWMEWIFVHGDDPLPPHVAARLIELLTTKPRYRGGSFSASSAGSCQRAQIYAYLNLLKRQPDFQLANTFSDGRYRHLRWQGMLLAAGIITDVYDVEYPLPWPKMKALGTVDGYGVVPDDHPRNVWQGQEFGFELKGVSTFQFGRYKDDGPKSDHLDQVARYFLMSGWPLFSIMYEDKTTQSTFEWVIEAEDPDMQQRIEAQREELRALNDAVQTKTIPPRLPECARLRGNTFSECPFGRSVTGPCATVSLWPTQRKMK